MNSSSGFRANHWRRLFRGGRHKPATAGGRGPHLAIPPPDRARQAHPERDDPGDRLRATLERWTRLNAPIPEPLIRRGLVAVRADRETLGAAVRFAEDGRIATRLHESAHFTVDVVCWRSGQIGPIRSHGDSARGLLVVEGTATEIVFEDAPCGLLAPSRSHVVPTGAVSVARRGEVRSVGNLQAPGADLIALIVVSPPAPDDRARPLADTVLAGLDAAG